MSYRLRINRFFGVWVHVHVATLLVLPLVVVQTGWGHDWWSPLMGVAGLIGYLLALAVHETAHVGFAHRRGARIAEVLVAPFGGLYRFARLPENSEDTMTSALAGPVSNLLVAWLCEIGTNMPVASNGEPTLIAEIFQQWKGLNMLLFWLNLVPSFPQDANTLLRLRLHSHLLRDFDASHWARLGRLIAALIALWAILPPFNLLLLAASVWIGLVAGAEIRLTSPAQGVSSQKRYRRFQLRWPWPIAEGEVYVSPPPYGVSGWRDAFEHHVQRMWEHFDNLLIDWYRRL